MMAHRHLPGSATKRIGQYEPLTRRLHNLLKEYKDGFSIPKELIQNAEDAGATEVCFLYDERQNLNARTNLLCDGLAEFQGPALWAYNNKPFTKKDIENIQELGGASKEKDTTKVGKFGLGFNSVYNLTDLPSFITGNQAVIFDPHEKYTGERGLSTDLMIETDICWKNQLKPYDGLFGCELDSTETICNGVLFRFPLRTSQQATRSDIKKLSYSPQDMKNFFTVFAEYAGSLLLFTQNVQSVTFYFLSETGNPEDVTELVSVRKNTVYKHLVCHGLPKDERVMNILEYSSKALGSDEMQYVEEKNEIHVTFEEHSYNAACKLEPMTNRTTWQVLWSTGDKDAKLFARGSELKGLVPLGAVAIYLKSVHTNGEEPCTVSDCGMGFYKNGHLFSFMPLPIATDHNIHINATFALTPDRRQLCIKSTDDTDSEEAKWNKVLETHVIGQAWAYALQNMSHIDMLDETTFYELWPHVSNFTYADGILKSFYAEVIQRDLKIFCRDNGKRWSSFTEIFLLDPQLRNDITVGSIALSAFKKFLDGVEGWVIDLPNTVLQSIQSCEYQDEINSRTFTEEMFFKDIFFPNISDRLIFTEDRNKLISYALLSSNEELQDMLKVNKCIPTKPDGKLKMPSQLVSPRGQSADLFLETEEVFPHAFFCDHLMLKALENLGMVVDELSSQQIADRGTLIQERMDVHIMRKLLSYLSRNPVHKPFNRRFEICSDYVQKKLQSTKLLPVLMKPKDWPFKWNGDAGSFAAPSDLYQADLINLVGCCKNILDASELQITASAYDVLNWLGIKSKTDVQPASVVIQLKCLSSGRENLSDVSIRKLSAVSHTVYQYLENYCVMAKRTSKPSKIQSIHDALKSHPIVLSANKLIEPQKMAFNLMLPLEPYLYKVDKELQELYPHFLKAVGIEKHFGPSDILDVLTTISHDAQGSILKKEMLKCFCIAVQVLVEAIERDESPVPEVQLPSIDGQLHTASKLCLNDCGWIHNQTHMLFLHPNISPKDGQALGVRTKREASLSKHVTAIPHAQGFGPHETLTKRLSNILGSYPIAEASIMKELLQNADDAGASELTFIKDFRNHKTEKIFGDEWKQLQGPALCVFNNSYFREEDIIGIQNLGEGSKGQDPLKIGRYGVGFNVVYHLTDVPSFMTVGPGKDKKLCVIDPHQCYTPRTEEATPGIQFNNLHILQDTYKDVFSCYFEDSIMRTQKGTLFRFPLRNEHMAEKSKLSKCETTTSQLEKMLDTFKKEAWSSILFLTNIKKISISSVSMNGNISVEYTVEASVQTADQDSVQTYISPEHPLSSIKQHRLQIVKTIMDSKKRKQKWLIIQQFGFDSEFLIPEDLEDHWKNGDFKLLPKGGVAVPFHNQYVKGKFFCELPLPKNTGLPIHINGHFELEGESRRDLWQGTSDYKALWNELIIEAIICPAYVKALQALQMNFPEDGTQCYFDAPIKDYQKLFPRYVNASNDYIRLLVKTFYTTIAKEQIPLFPVLMPKSEDFLLQSSNTVVRLEWVTVVTEAGFPGFFNVFDNFLIDNQSYTLTQELEEVEAMSKSEETQMQDKRKLALILKALGMRILEFCSSIKQEFDNTDVWDKVKATSPDNVIIFLQSCQAGQKNGCEIGCLPKPVFSTPLQSVDNVKLITKFCQLAEKFEQKIINLPLMVSQSQILSYFSVNKKYFVTTYNDLLPKSADHLIHDSLVHLYDNVEVAETSCLRRMDIPAFSHFLNDNLDKTVFKIGQPVPLTSSTSEAWICRLWEFLGIEVQSQIRKTRFTERDVKEKEMAMSQLDPLREWSLIPVFLTEADNKGNLTHSPCLYPLERSKCVISLLNSSDYTFLQVLKKLCLPKLMSSTVILDTHTTFRANLYLCTLAVADMSDPESMLEALFQTSGSDSHLSITECGTVLSYFEKNMDVLENSVPNLSHKLKMLPYFSSLSGVSVGINNCDHVQVVKDDYPFTPRAGLEDLFSNQRCMLILYKSYYERILEHLELPCLSREKAYIEIILPHLMTFNPQDRMKHLLHIRNNIVKDTLNPCNETRDLLNILSEIPFILIEDGQYLKASEFYSIKVVEFRTMCSSNAFLPPPFNKEEWQHLLELIGLKCQISVDDFVQFARRLERDSGRNITESVAVTSKLLVKHLQERTDLLQEELLCKIGDICFLLPYDIEKEEDGVNLKAIHSQYENAGKLVSFSESCDPIFYHSIWTSSSMWSKDADISRCLTQEHAETARSQLDISRDPTLEVLVTHLQNICSILKEKDVIFKQERSILLKTVFTNLYQLLQKHKDNRMSARLQSLSTVYIVEQCEVVPAEDVVIELPSSENIPGYIFKASTVFGNFFSLFEALGAQKITTANTYALVLQKLFKKTRGESLNPNELKVVVQHALFNLINCLLVPERANIQTNLLYLPNTDHILTDATSLIYMDNNAFKKRLKPLNYFLGFKPMNMSIHRMPEFPAKYKMVSLTTVVKETLSPSCLDNVAQCGSALNYEKKIQSLEFVKGILRICNHNCQEFSENDASEIEDRLAILKIRQVEELETVLVYEGNIVHGSELKRECFIMKTHFHDSEESCGPNMTVYLSPFRTKESNVLFSIASAIDSLTGDSLRRFVSAVEKMLLADPEDISEILDEHDVVTYTQANIRADNETYPRSGTLIPDELQWMLDNSFTRFDEGEYVGLDVFDPFADESKSTEDYQSLPVYVYAIVVKVEDNDSPMAATYLVEVAENVTQIVSAIVLYKFHREKINTTTDLVPSGGNLFLNPSSSGHIDNILDDIRLQLQGAWDKLNPSERKRVRLRLLSQWHPDRNPDNAPLCTEVCQFIGLYIQQLEDGESLDVVDARQATFDSSFYNEVTRRTNLHQTFRQSSGSRSYASCHQAARRQAYPHLGEAQRWFQQAKRDLEAARQAMSAFTPGNYNWICYMSHQAGEKALKAVLYTIDSVRADELKVHNLPEIASGLDSTLQELALQLTHSAQHHNRMRYPQRVNFPRIPGDEYTRPDAEATFRFAEAIVNIASEKLQQ